MVNFRRSAQSRDLDWPRRGFTGIYPSFVKREFAFFASVHCRRVISRRILYPKPLGLRFSACLLLIPFMIRRYFRYIITICADSSGIQHGLLVYRNHDSKFVGFFGLLCSRTRILISLDPACTVVRSFPQTYVTWS